MALDVIKTIGDAKLGPVVVIDSEEEAVPAAEAFVEGGVPVMEITLRTEAGLSAIKKVSENFSDVLVGAGTVLGTESCKKAIDAGAKFIVSPGFDEEVIEYCINKNIPVFPGTVTPSEITRALKFGLNILKFFPANIYGGAKAIKALAGPFPHVKFIPTGGVSAENLKDFLIPEVFAIGGGWLYPVKQIKQDGFSAITKACKRSREIIVM
jgi:2-dehydro-3-deoxyphosphogluconate aldolase/(4S)-4-hydroxy-2-oxoglutarate aldolase